MNELTIITSLALEDGKIVATRARIAGVMLLGEPPPLVLYVDPSKEPRFSPHPDGGWCSPTYERLSLMKELGTEPEFIEHVRCKCHKQSHTSEDEQSLKIWGHAASCPRRNPVASLPPVPHAVIPVTPAAAATTPTGPATAPQGDAPFIKDPRARNMMGMGQPKAAAPAPPGGLDDGRLSTVASVLAGSGSSVGEALLELGMAGDPIVVANQLKTDFHMINCNTCGAWGQSAGGSRCGSCAGQ